MVSRYRAIVARFSAVPSSFVGFVAGLLLAIEGTRRQRT